MRKIELKACPFCGSDHTEIRFVESEDGSKRYAVMCRDCRVGIFVPHLDDAEEWKSFLTPEAAAKAWNRRSTYKTY